MQIPLPEYTKLIDSGELHIKFEPSLDIVMIVVIHSTKLGPTLGGCRMVEYPDLDSAILDAVRLARGMSFKAAMCQMALGGGKSVIIKSSKIQDTSNREKVFEIFGRFVEDLGGRYITAVDSGTTITDMEIAAKHTKYVSSRAASGNPAPFTAHGVRRAIQAAVKFKLGRDDIQGIHVAIQGVGHVGYNLAKELHKLGAKLTVNDINHESVQRCVDEFNATPVSAEEIITQRCDVYAPCALGGAINDDTVKTLDCDIVCGAANNQLLELHHGEMLHQRDILYTPDYVINAGGLIHCGTPFVGLSDAQRHEKIEQIYGNTMAIFERADKEQKPTAIVADLIAKERLGL